MTYSQQVKNELCHGKFSCENCQKAFVYGMLLTSRGVSNKSFTVNTENKLVADFLAENIIDLTGSIVTVQHPDFREKNKRPIYTVSLENTNDIENILKLYDKKAVLDKTSINWSMIRNICCQNSFLRGTYLSCGAMSNPEKEYHLEFCLSNESVCDDILDLLYNVDLDFRKATRGKNFIAYVKESQQIEDTLTYLGAIRSSMELMNLKIVKEIRNTANRRTIMKQQI